MGAAEDQKTIAGLQQQLAEKAEELNQLRLAGKASAAASAGSAPQAAQLARLQRLLWLKQEALTLKEKYLAWLEASGEAAR
jgi:hypothetical protein